MQHDYVLYANDRTRFESDEMLELFRNVNIGDVPMLAKGRELWMEYYPQDGISGFAQLKTHRVTPAKKSARILYSCERCYRYNQAFDIGSKPHEEFYVIQNPQRFAELVGEDPKFVFIGI
jgi:hypothetical protein